MRKFLNHDENTWMTLFDKEYKEKQFLYHYTDINKAMKILYTDSLKFSKLCKTNDTMESKPKIMLDESGKDDANQKAKLRDYFFKTNSSCIQLLCFTEDQQRIVDSNANETKVYSDYSGRGFSLPRMWAQYAENNTGVCLMFNRSKLHNIIMDSIEEFVIKYGEVKYINQFSEYLPKSETIKRILSNAEKHSSDVETTVRNQFFFRKNEEFVDYNYFHKLDDWSGEKEYRYIAYGDNELFVEGISAALSGVIIGENIDPVYERIITLFCHKVCDVKKISFTCDGCKISNIHSEQSIMEEVV